MHPEATSTPSVADDLFLWIRNTPRVAAVGAGLLGGVAMAAWEMTAARELGLGWLAPLRMIGAGHPGDDSAMTGLVMHVVTSAFWGTRLGYLLEHAPARLRRFPASAAIGLAWGLALWALMGMVVGPLFSPLMVNVHPVHYLAGHLAYGLVSVIALSAYLERRRASARRDDEEPTGAPDVAPST